MRKEIENVLITKEQIAERVVAIAKEISSDYSGEQLTAVCILRGAAIFFADLIRAVAEDVELMLDYIYAESYEGAKSSGEVQLDINFCTPIAGKNVLIVEDIVDSGRTLCELKRSLTALNPKSLRVCVLLDKPAGRAVEFAPDYVGFDIPNAFVVGYGLDYNEHYRNLADICILKKEYNNNEIT